LNTTTKKRAAKWGYEDGSYAENMIITATYITHGDSRNTDEFVRKDEKKNRQREGKAALNGAYNVNVTVPYANHGTMQWSLLSGQKKRAANGKRRRLLE